MSEAEATFAGDTLVLAGCAFSGLFCGYTGIAHKQARKHRTISLICIWNLTTPVMELTSSQRGFLTANKALAQGTERSRKATIIYIYQYVNVLLGVFQDRHFDVVVFAFKIELVRLITAKFGKEMLQGNSDQRLTSASKTGRHVS